MPERLDLPADKLADKVLTRLHALEIDLRDDNETDPATIAAERLDAVEKLLKKEAGIKPGSTVAKQLLENLPIIDPREDLADEDINAFAEILERYLNRIEIRKVSFKGPSRQKS